MSQELYQDTICIQTVNPAAIGIITLTHWYDQLEQWRKTSDLDDLDFPCLEDLEKVFEDIVKNGELIPLDIVMGIIGLERAFWAWRSSEDPLDKTLQEYCTTMITSYERLVEKFASTEYSDLCKSVQGDTNFVLLSGN